jgi:predicted metal-dependent phosphoesterase TrpH
MIDLHLHTTASDGLLAPPDLVALAAASKLTVISVTDHDTVAGLASARAAAARVGIQLIPGIEVTAVRDGQDVHVLGYFIDPDSAALGEFLAGQRANRVRRVQDIGARLQALGMPIDVGALLAGAQAGGRSIGRPAVADALVAAGHAAGRDEAFERWLGRGRPAFVPRRGASGRDVIQVIHAAGGIASLAHPGLLAQDDWVPDLVEVGLDAIEVWHSDHTPEDVARYDALAARYRLARSGGSDYHGAGVHRESRLGSVTLPPAEFAALAAAAQVRR